VAAVGLTIKTACGQISVEPSSICPGEPLTITGVSFVPGSKCILRVFPDNTCIAVCEVQADAAGGFVLPVDGEYTSFLQEGAHAVLLVQRLRSKGGDQV
jgi:hypothetical protein